MEIKNLFDTTIYTETVQRIEQLTSHTKGLWGKMNVAQMMAHSNKVISTALLEKMPPRMFLSYILGGYVSNLFYGEKPWKQSMPTAKVLVTLDERDFETEKNKLVDSVKKFYAITPQKFGDKIHPMAGKMTAEQWGKSMWKHLDHHLRQFGV